MSFEWRDFLSVAHSLNLEMGPSAVPEACARSAVSRAYYAAFCHARNYARDVYGYTPTNDPNDHWRVRKQFVQRKQSAVASQLDELRKWRNRCDYRDDVSNVTGIPAKALKAAQKVLDALT